MAYTDRNFKTKKELLTAFKAGEKLTVYKPNDMFGNGSVPDGNASIEGPHYPQPHRFYLSVVVEDGVIVKVKG